MTSDLIETLRDTGFFEAEEEGEKRYRPRQDNYNNISLVKLSLEN